MDVATKQYVDTAVAGSTISPATTSTLGGVIVGTGMTVSSAGLVALNYPTDTEMEEMLTANGLTATIIENWEEASEGGVS